MLGLGLWPTLREELPGGKSERMWEQLVTHSYHAAGSFDALQRRACGIKVAGDESTLWPHSTRELQS